MSLERKDLRVYFDADIHAGLVAIAEIEDIEPAKLVERMVSDRVRAEVRRATLLASRPDVAGLSGISPADVGRGVVRVRGERR